MSGKWKNYGEFLKMAYTMYHYSNEEITSALHIWLIDNDIWFEGLTLHHVGNTQFAYQKEFKVKFRIEGFQGEFCVGSSELNLREINKK